MNIRTDEQKDENYIHIGINVGGIISRIVDCLLRFKPENSIEFGYFNIYEQFKYHAQLN